MDGSLLSHQTSAPAFFHALTISLGSGFSAVGAGTGAAAFGALACVALFAPSIIATRNDASRSDMPSPPVQMCLGCKNQMTVWESRLKVAGRMARSVVTERISRWLELNTAVWQRPFEFLDTSRCLFCLGQFEMSELCERGQLLRPFLGHGRLGQRERPQFSEADEMLKAGVGDRRPD